MNHITPLPWKITKNEALWDSIISANGEVVASTEGLMEDSEDNAAFIVKAVNHYNDLVQACSAIANSYSSNGSTKKQQAAHALIRAIVGKINENI